MGLLFVFRQVSVNTANSMGVGRTRSTLALTTSLAARWSLLSILAAMCVCAIVLAGFVPPLSAQPPHEERCVLEAGPRHAVDRVVDAETVLLDDGRQVRLIGALAPRAPNNSPAAARWRPEQDAVAALRDLIRGRSVELAFSGRHLDRYGHLLAHLFFEQDGERVWVQGYLLSKGQARAYGLPGSFACMRELLAHEQVARAAGIGLWSSAAYATRPAARTRELMRLRNSYQIVEGRVAHVASLKSHTYLNFGTNWRNDFTAGVSPKLRRANPEWAKSLAALEGKHIQVRGWIEYRNGPYIAIDDPNQIETVEVGPNRPPQKSGGTTMSSDHGTTGSKEKKNRPAQKKPGGVDL